MDQVPQTECAEDFDVVQEFHRKLAALNGTYGAGMVTAVVWSVAKEPPGTRTGIAVVQLGDGMAAKRFTVTHTDADYTLKFLGKTIKVESDYFGD